MWLLLLGAVAARAYGAAIRANWRNPIVDLIGGTVCALAAWLAAGAIGAWSPVWLALVLGFVGGLIIAVLPRQFRFVLWWAFDGLIFAASAQFSVPPLDLATTVAGALLVIVAAILLDALAAWVRKAVRTGGIVAASVAAALTLVAVPVLPWSLREGLAPLSTLELATSLANLGIIPARSIGAERVTLSSGAVAWLDRPSGDGPFPGAVFFHGGHRAGSFQPAAVAARRALLDAGFIVLAVDHPGYGESPAPSVSASMAQWDPLPTALAALAVLRKDPAVNRVIIVGHSMGTSDVMRLLVAKAGLDGAVLFGSRALDDERPDYWRWRFLHDRRLAPDSMPAERVQELIDRYYDPGRFAQNLEVSHPPVVFGRFEHEWPTIVSHRDQLFAQFPGRKALWDVSGSHYFNSFGYAGFVAGDMRIIHAVGSRLKQIAADLKNGAAIAHASSAR